MTPRESFGRFLRNARRKAGLSQVDVGKQLGFHPQFTSNWERGMSTPPRERLPEIAKMYGLSRHAVLDAWLKMGIRELKQQRNELRKVFKEAKAG